MVDIFEAGPIVQCQMKDIRTARESRKEKIVQIADGLIDSPPPIVHAGAPRYRTTIGQVDVSVTGGVPIGAPCAAALGIDVGDTVRFAPLRGAQP